MKVVLRIYYFLTFLLFYFVKLVQANFYIAYDILTPKMNTNPGFITVPLVLKSDLELLLFSNLVSMTPGTLSINVSEDKQSMLVHILYKNNEEQILKEIQGVQKRIRKIIYN